MTRMLVIGDNSLGFILGGLAAGSGVDVTFAIDDEYSLYSIRKNGLYLFGSGINRVLPVNCIADYSELRGSYNFLLLNGTGSATVHDISFVLDHLQADAAVLCCQNGILEDLVEDIAGSQTIISMLSGITASAHAPGNVEIVSFGKSFTGLWKGDVQTFRHYSRFLESIIPVSVHPEIIPLMYSRLVFDACLGPICAISGIHYGAMLRNRRIRSLIIGVMSEAVQVAEALGYAIEPYKRVFNYYSFLRGDNPVARFNRHCVLFLTSFFFEEKISLMLRAILDGKHCDIEGINGFIARTAKTVQIITPLNDLLIRMVKEIENRRRGIGMENFREELFYFYG